MQLNSERILIIDYGSQYTQLIARRVREAGVYCEIFPSKFVQSRVKHFDPKGIILSGGPDSATESDLDSEGLSFYLSLGVPLLGICFGMQSLALWLGGQVENAEKKEFGFAQVRARGHSRLLNDLQDSSNSKKHGLLDVWMSHGDSVTELPPGFKVIASTENTPIAGIANESENIYGLQFHPEVTHTKQGKAILERFCLEICGCEKSWNTEDFVQDSIRSIKEAVGSDRVLLGLSGGVDSSVAATLLHKAIGEQLICVFVDNGLLRLRESDQVMRTFKDSMGLDVRLVNAREEFLSALKGVIDPEEKRKVIGNKFVEIFERESKGIKGVEWLAQGTIYPDVIESAGEGDDSHVIKSHHNVGGLPENMKMKLIEPLRRLFKDEVRKVGRALDIPDSLVFRHPFPGPGLGVRVLGEIKPEYLDILRAADHIFVEEIQKAGLYDRISQAFTVFLPVSSVGVKGDARSYEYVVALRAVKTDDFMTAECVDFDHAFLDGVVRKIINQVPRISRVVYDITSKPPGTIEWE